MTKIIRSAEILSHISTAHANATSETAACERLPLSIENNLVCYSSLSIRQSEDMTVSCTLSVSRVRNCIIPVN